MKFIAVILSLQLSGILAFAGEIRGENYFTHCDQLTGMFSKLSPEDTIERRFVDGAKTQGQMAQLLKDYDILFSKELGEAILLEAMGGQKKIGSVLRTSSQNSVVGSVFSGRALRTLRFINWLPQKKFNAFVWKVLDRVAWLMADQKSDPQGQVRYLQAKNLLEALKVSPQRQAAEEIFSLLIRHSLIKKIEELRIVYSWGSAKRLERNAVATGIIAGLLSATFMYNHGDPTLASDPVFAKVILSGMQGAIVGMIIGGLTFGLGAAAAAARSYVKKILPPRKSDSVTFKFLQDANQGEKWVAEEALKYIDPAQNVDPKLSLSIKDGCEANACKLTPVQLAYLGHIDLLELEALGSAVKEALKKYNSEDETLQLAELARGVMNEPREFIKQMQLKSALIVFVEKMKGLLETQQKAVEAMTEYVASSTAQFSALSRRPYDMEPRSQDEILKAGLLMAKIRSDLKTLESVKVNSVAMSAKISHSQQVVQTLTNMIDQLPRSEEGWKEAAEEIILRLDELQ